jgi:hypothetical protein
VCVWGRAGSEFEHAVNGKLCANYLTTTPSSPSIKCLLVTFIAYTLRLIKGARDADKHSSKCSSHACAEEHFTPFLFLCVFSFKKEIKFRPRNIFHGLCVSWGWLGWVEWQQSHYFSLLALSCVKFDRNIYNVNGENERTNEREREKFSKHIGERSHSLARTRMKYETFLLHNKSCISFFER